MANKITAFDKQTSKALGEAINAALATVAAEHGLDSIKITSATFGSGSVTLKGIAKVNPATNAVVQQTHKSYSEYLGYSQNIVGEEFTMDGKKFRVTDIVVTRRKYPIEAMCLGDQKSYSISNNKRLSFAKPEIKWEATAW